MFAGFVGLGDTLVGAFLVNGVARLLNTAPSVRRRESKRQAAPRGRCDPDRVVPPQSVTTRSRSGRP
jgi:hypothetical protein